MIEKKGISHFTVPNKSPHSPLNTDNCRIGDYAHDIHLHLRNKEKERLPFRGHSTQLDLRPRMLEFLDSICCRRMLCSPVQHLAAYLLDVFMEHHYVAREHWRLIVVGCLSVAAKLEENNDLIPSNKDFNMLLGKKYALVEIVNFEVCVLTFFEWNVMFPTVAHFLEYYELYALLPSIDGLRRARCTYGLIKRCMRRYLEYFLHVVLEDTSFYAYSPSVIAASCVASARLHMALAPTWNNTLCDVTQYNYKELKPCVRQLIRILHKDMRKFKSISEKNANSKQDTLDISCFSKSIENPQLDQPSTCL